MTARTAMIRARTTPDIKETAERVFEALGLTATDAINMFYHQVALSRSIPFDVKLPNKTTIKAIEDARVGKGMKTHASSADLFKDLEL
jgi:DNA-damage-inducible protein J